MRRRGRGKGRGERERAYLLVQNESFALVREGALLQGPCDVDGWSGDISGCCSDLEREEEGGGRREEGVEGDKEDRYQYFMMKRVLV